MSRAKILLILVLVFAGGSFFRPIAPAIAASSAPGRASSQGEGKKVVVMADHIRFNRVTHLIHAVGHGFLQKGILTLNADEIILNKVTNVVWAAGHVVFHGPKTVMKGPRMKLNLVTGHAIVYNGKVVTRQIYTQYNVRTEYTYHIRGKKIERVSPTHFHVDDGSVTTCDCLPNASPSWLLTTNSGDVFLNDHFSSSGDFLNIKSVPSLYLPYFSFPIAPRKSGFLFPFIQYNSTQGFVFYDSFFWNLDPSYDLTFTFDDMSNFGIGEGVTYNQAISSNQNLSLNITQQAVNDTTLGLNTSILSTTDLYSYLGENSAVIANINYVSAQDFYQLMSTGSTAAFNPQLMSSLFANFYQDNSEVNLAGEYNENIFPGPNTSVSKLPQGSSNIYDYKLGDTPFYFSSFLSGVDFQTGSLFLQRGVVYPRLSGSFSLDDLVEISPHAGVLEAAYSVSNTATPGPYSQTVPNFGVALQSMVERDFQLPDSLGGGVLTHEIEVNSDFEYAPQNNETAIIQSGFTDNVLGMNTLYYSVTNRLFYTGKSLSEEILSLKIAEDYQMQSQTYNSTPVNYAGQFLSNPFLPLNQPYSPIYASLHVLPNNPLSFFGEGFYDPVQNDIATEDTAIVFNQAALYPAPVMFLLQLGQTSIRAGNVPVMGNFFNPMAITVSYQQPEGANFFVPSISVNTSLGLFGGIAYYQDISGSGIQMESVNFGYNGQCWNMGFMYYVVEEPSPLPAQTGFGFTLTLNGIASLAPILNPISPVPVP